MWQDTKCDLKKEQEKSHTTLWYATHPSDPLASIHGSLKKQILQKSTGPGDMMVRTKGWEGKGREGKGREVLSKVEALRNLRIFSIVDSLVSVVHGWIGAERRRGEKRTSANHGGIQYGRAKGVYPILQEDAGIRRGGNNWRHPKRRDAIFR